MLCKPFESQEESNLHLVKGIKNLVKSLKDRVEEEGKEGQTDNSFVGRVDPNKQLKVDAEELLTDNLVQGVNATLSEILFYSCLSQT